MFILPIITGISLALTSTASTSLFVSGVTLSTTTYIAVRKTKKK